jgi:hypothetical protein
MTSLKSTDITIYQSASRREGGRTVGSGKVATIIE